MQREKERGIQCEKEREDIQRKTERGEYVKREGNEESKSDKGIFRKKNIEN